MSGPTELDEAVEQEDDLDFQIPDLCGRQSCKKVILQPAGRGRRREFCSETCRRGADREFKRAKQLVEHYERALRKTRHEVASYGRKSEDLAPEEEAAQQATLLAALSRAEGALEFSAESTDPFRAELIRLVEALAPTMRRENAVRASA